MTKWAYEFLGLVLWIIFVHLIAPDISHVRSLLASLIGYFAVCSIARAFSARDSRVGEEEKPQSE
ncbi:hypothetical protein Desti_0122 [Desulfomonile tiedjei DSM 6799]|uniref:Uncharacterized protein n=1 Tax=Desulfomonile tiedjei (strain ATCC 49306 / DSM 6799 / DCB-1) TaxID=706587 RepID=I4BZX9_DESTA|nr:hypothetical protein Desti_0122 [Desulfomonile tiedjei DSM 6799]